MSTDLRSAKPRLRLMLKWAVDTAKIGAVCVGSRAARFTGARGVVAKIECHWCCAWGVALPASLELGVCVEVREVHSQTRS